MKILPNVNKTIRLIFRTSVFSFLAIALFSAGLATMQASPAFSDNHAAPDAPDRFRVMVQKNTSVTLGWRILDDNGSPVTGHVVKYRKIDSPAGNWLSSSSNTGQVQPYIVGGGNVDIEDHPYQVRLEMYDSNVELIGSCGGTILTDRWVLTAAHCLDDPNVFLVAVEYGVTLVPASENFVWATSMQTHPSWDRATFTNDIALLSLANSPLDMSKVGTLPLYDFDSLAVGTPAYITGWGCTYTGCEADTPAHLQGVEVQISSCANWDNVTVIPATQVCAEGNAFENSCSGDSGGPLVTNVDGILYVTGVVSYGNSQFGCAVEDWPSVYTRVSEYVDWIEGYTGALWTSTTRGPEPVETFVGPKAGESYAYRFQAANSVGRSDVTTVVVSGDDRPYGNMISQGKPEISGSLASGNRFGAVMVTGDFDNDSYEDLVVGSPGAPVGGVSGAGKVHVFSGPGVLNGDTVLTQNTAGFVDSVEANDGFGSVLAVGDFNNDGFDDLAIGSPDEDLGGTRYSNAGIVEIAYGSGDGFVDQQRFHQYSPGVANKSEKNDRFGSALAAGDFNNDGFDDLAIGVPGEGYSRGRSKAGTVHVLYGSEAGLSGTGSGSFHQNTPGIPSTVEANDLFGFSLSAGDVNGDGFDDLAVGSPGEKMGRSTNAGIAHILYGSAAGVKGSRSSVFYQGMPGWSGKTETNDRFGEVVALGDLNEDGTADLVVGVPGEGFSKGRTQAGMVQIKYNPKGWTGAAESVQTIHQNTPGVKNTVEANDRFGAQLLLVDAIGDGALDLLIGVPGESVAGKDDAGAVAILPGSGGKISTGADRVLYPRQNDFSGKSQADAEFGTAFALLSGDLMIGAPGHTILGKNQTGVFYLLDY